MQQEGGYASCMSVQRGDQIALCMASSRSYCDLFIYHEGARRRLVKEINGLRGSLQPIPQLGYRDGFGCSRRSDSAYPGTGRAGAMYL
jgi:hypothetical protein